MYDISGAFKGAISMGEKEPTLANDKCWKVIFDFISWIKDYGIYRVLGQVVMELCCSWN
jgi:hypothetical protein